MNEIEALRSLYNRHDEDLRTRWRRSLSFEDGVFDRWERARRLGWGEGTSIYNSAMVLEPVSVGANTWIGPWTLLDGSGGGLTIGDWVGVAAGAHIYTHDTVSNALSGGRIPPRIGRVTIGDCTYVGPQSVITAGVTIGDHCVIGANSFVSRDVPARTIVAGSPARRVGTVTGDGEAVVLEIDGSVQDSG